MVEVVDFVCTENEFFVNEYICGFGLGFGDLDLGCGKVLWKTHIQVGFCYVMGLWKSVY